MDWTVLEQALFEHPEWITAIVIWDGLWKAFALWHAARNRQLLWFILLVVINSVGLLPMAYLAFFRPVRKKQPVSGKRPASMSKPQLRPLPIPLS